MRNKRNIQGVGFHPLASGFKAMLNVNEKFDTIIHWRRSINRKAKKHSKFKSLKTGEGNELANAVT